MDLSTSAATWAGLGSALLLAALHLAAPRLRTLRHVPERALGSFAGGLAVSYVFLHLLPEIASGNEGIAAALQDTPTPTPLLDLSIFAVALTGFLVFFALERLADEQSHGRRAGTSSALALRVHVGAFSVYNAVITYTMPLRFRTGVAFALLFTVAMGLHFVLTDRGLSEHYGKAFGQPYRLVLAGAVLLGWVLARSFAPTRVVVVDVLTAFLGGSVLLNVFKEELPAEGRSSLAWLTVGLGGYGALLAAVTALSE